MSIPKKNAFLLVFLITLSALRVCKQLRQEFEVILIENSKADNSS